MWFQHWLKWVPHIDTFAFHSTNPPRAKQDSIYNALSVQCCLFILFAWDLISLTYHTDPRPKLGTTVMQSASPEQENVQVLLAFSTLKRWSRANHAITQEDVLLTQLCSTSWSKQQSDALLIFQKIDQSWELETGGMTLPPNQETSDLRGVFLWLSTCLHTRWSHCPYPVAVPEMGMRQKGHEWPVIFSICTSMAQGELENL